ncbi:MAG: hypothetical protein A2428_15670 [Bdellovibrionales bacterium RIFOXYC1_FULL_54_43]|nr:MAG: hypothetical protein A2428_15670 [Bdellovibrionales bacterium RIFOXYC1_FULL_54_43]OFZ78533.1 MAG: hypothetical protein A2603_01750 [Bdellovibrionales bacterium RIFOXYD1_FULL_55_31]
MRGTKITLLVALSATLLAALNGCDYTKVVAEDGTRTMSLAGPEDIVAGKAAYGLDGVPITGIATKFFEVDLETTAASQLTSGFYQRIIAPSITGANICSGSMILGMSGTANCAGSCSYALKGNFDLRAAFAGEGVYSSASGLTAAEVCSTTTVLGSAGTAVCQSGTTASGAAAADILSGKEAWNSTGTKLTGTLLNRGSWNIDSSGFPGAGYYSNVSTTLSASSICGGYSLMGSPGTAVCATGTLTSPAGPPNLLAGFQTFDGSGSVITGTMANGGSLNAQASFPGAGYYSGISSLPVSSQIVSGQTILGVAGTAAFPDFVWSNAYRTKGALRLTLREELANSWPPAIYRFVPQVSSSDEGNSASTSITFAPRPGSVCGITQPTVEQRISDCASLNGANANWDGGTNGNAGQDLWKLVTRTADAKEVWRDEKTGLLWSDYLGTPSTVFNWCKASGSSNRSGSPYAEDDPVDICDAVAYQNQTTPESECFEDPTWLTTNAAYTASKGGMGRASTPSVVWRLPTIYDYKQADIDGIRFVLPNMHYNFWTATVRASARANAWTFIGQTGEQMNATRSTVYPIRCVGHAL